MSTTITVMDVQGYERFTPSAQEAIHAAQRLALSMNAPSVDPEHLLLSIILQRDERVTHILSRLGIDGETIHTRVAEMTRHYASAMGGEDELPLSKEAQECLSWTLAFISYMCATTVFPDHLFLGVLRHHRTQPLLALLLPSFILPPGRIVEEIGPAYTVYIDQLISTRVRDQSMISSGRGMTQRILRKFERPSVTFVDIIGLENGKRELRHTIEYLRGTPTFQQTGGRFPHGVLLIGSTGNDRRLLAQSIAGEAVVPLITLSMVALVELLIDLHSGTLRLEDLELPTREYTLLRRGSLAEKGQRYLQHLFQQAKHVSPSIILLEDIDAIARLGKDEGRERILYQLFAEIDGLDKHYRMMVIASAARPVDVDPSLFKPGRLEHRLVLESAAVSQSELGRFCSSCRREVSEEWQYCVYCGVSLVVSCPHCGAPHPTVAGARFCSVCGGVL